MANANTPAVILATVLFLFLLLKSNIYNTSFQKGISMKFFLFPSVVILMLVIKHNIEKAGTGNESMHALLADETKANATRKQDVSSLPYISLGQASLPFGKLKPTCDNELKLMSLMDRQILNLTGITNTELKKMYGPANLDFLSQCDENFTTLIRCLNGFAQSLYDAGMTSDAKAVLEYSVKIGSDIRGTYRLLATIYSEEGDRTALQDLKKRADHLTGLSSKSIVKDIDTFL